MKNWKEKKETILLSLTIVWYIAGDIITTYLSQRQGIPEGNIVFAYLFLTLPILFALGIILIYKVVLVAFCYKFSFIPGYIILIVLGFLVTYSNSVILLGGYP